MQNQTNHLLLKVKHNPCAWNLITQKYRNNEEQGNKLVLFIASTNLLVPNGIPEILLTPYPDPAMTQSRRQRDTTAIEPQYNCTVNATQPHHRVIAASRNFITPSFLRHATPSPRHFCATQPRHYVTSASRNSGATSLPRHESPSQRHS